MTRLLLRRVQLLRAPAEEPSAADVLLDGGRIVAFLPAGSAAEGDGSATCLDAEGFWLAPCLVDPHSVLEDPLAGRAETLASLAAAALVGGYGTLALLPWGHPWRDRPDRLSLGSPGALDLRLWGSFSVDGLDRELAPHAEQLGGAVVGLAAGDALPPVDLLERGLLLGEMGVRPVLLAPRDAGLGRLGFMRERVEALRAGWPLDPVASEVLPLRSLLALAALRPERRLRVMNLSTREGVELLRQTPAAPPASVSCWHLLLDSGSRDPHREGWRLVPSLGAPQDREALIEALAEGVISAVAVHHQALDAEEQLLPLDQRRPGLAGHGLVLPLLWQELVQRRRWTVPSLWQALCWGPAAFLDLDPPELREGSQRWLLFDPARRWRPGSSLASLAANHPGRQLELQGAVLATGMQPPEQWLLAQSEPSLLKG
ncbi:MAG: dihydroorotase [Synechococcaceae cyanobacterium]|nr:dihydroorotase [Synechococcaceae cyanobacterium]